MTGLGIFCNYYSMNNICHKIMLTKEYRIYFKDQRRFSSRLSFVKKFHFFVNITVYCLGSKYLRKNLN